MEERPIDLAAIAEKVNSSPGSWKARVPSKFENMSRRDIKKMMGTVVDPDWVVRAPEVKTYNASESNQVIPPTFDSSATWPLCPNILWARDQSNCGSCWAHGTTEAFEDRLCIASGGNTNVKLSVSDTAGCCDQGQCLSFGCGGGQAALPWRWFKSVGVSTGGGYGDTEFCYAYTMAPCCHHVGAP